MARRRSGFGFEIDFKLNEVRDRKCNECENPMELGNLVMIVSHHTNGMGFDVAYHWSCIENKMEFAIEGNAKFKRLQERMVSGAQFFG